MANPTKPHEIEIEIGPNGEIKSTVHGVAGPDCAKLSAWLDDIGLVVEDVNTEDFNRREAVQVARPSIAC